MARKLTVAGIFGGIGGFELGLKHSGHKTAMFCEADPEAIAVLRKRFPKVPIATDVRKTDEVIATIPAKADLLTAGFPCTDLSQAGQTKGFAGGRSSLIRDTLELLRRRPFTNVLIENVPNWRHLHQGQYIAEVVTALEALGYRWAYRTIDALAFGLPQRRQRIFLFATMEGDPREALFHGDQGTEEKPLPLPDAAHGFYWTEGSRGLGWGEDCVPTLKGGSGIGIPSPPAILLPDLSVVTPGIQVAERLQGFDPGWTDLTVVREGYEQRAFNKRRRWMLVGNAVNVRVSRWIGEQLASRLPYDKEPGLPIERGKWPSAAWFDGKQRYAVELGTWPVARKREHLAKFVGKDFTPLSLRATTGFYSRISQSSLRFKAGFKEAIRDHASLMEEQESPRKGAKAA